MYDPVKMQERMAELGLNYRRVAQQAGIDPKTAQSIIETGRGWPDKIQAVAKVLKFTLPQIVKRRDPNAHLGSGEGQKRKKAS